MTDRPSGETVTMKVPDHSGYVKTFPAFDEESIGFAEYEERNTFVAIGGGTGSGKSTLASDLENMLDATVLSMDDFYKNELTVADHYDDPQAIGWLELSSSIADLVDGETTQVPTYSFERGRRDGFEQVDPADFIIVEGLWACSDKYHTPRPPDVSIYLDAPKDIRLARRVMRDVDERPHSAVETVEMYLDDARAAHEEYVEPTKANADIIIDSRTNCLSDVIYQTLQQQNMIDVLGESKPSYESTP